MKSAHNTRDAMVTGVFTKYGTVNYLQLNRVLLGVGVETW